jgi:hypothetical protein
MTTVKEMIEECITLLGTLKNRKATTFNMDKYMAGEHMTFKYTPTLTNEVNSIIKNLKEILYWNSLFKGKTNLESLNLNPYYYTAIDKGYCNVIDYVSKVFNYIEEGFNKAIFDDGAMTQTLSLLTGIYLGNIFSLLKLSQYLLTEDIRKIKHLKKE